MNYYNNTKINYNEQLAIPLSQAFDIPDDDVYYDFIYLTHALDYSKLLNQYDFTIGRDNYHDPVTLFKVVAFANVLNLQTGRAIAKLCKVDIRLLAILGGKKAPSASTISRFRRKLKSVMDDLFRQLNEELIMLNEITYDHLYIDGTKIEAYASRFSFVWLKACNRHFHALENKVLKLFQTLDTLQPNFQVPQVCLDASTLTDVMTNIMHEMMAMGLALVYGKGKHKHPLQRIYDDLNECQKKWLKYQDYFSVFKGRNSFSKTDRDATFMRMKDDAMKNGQLKAGYNIQIAVSNEYIVGVDISGHRNDVHTLIPFLEYLKVTYPQTWKNIVADSGYESEENYSYLLSRQYECYIKPANHQQKKKRSFKQHPGRRENMTYCADNDYYVCANDRKLVFISEFTKTNPSGYEATVRKYQCEDCSDCPHRQKCTTSKNDNFRKTIQFSPLFDDLRALSEENIHTDLGIQLRMNRSAQVEGAFGIIKQNFGYRRIFHRGKEMVRLEFLLVAFAFNIRKFHQKMKTNRKGPTFYEKVVA